MKKESIPEMLTFIKRLRQSMDAFEFSIISTVVGQFEPMLLFLSKIGLRTLPPVYTKS
jgi:hypothetical protein